MRLNISRITEIIADNKPLEGVILQLYKQRDDYVPYTLIKPKDTVRKLVFKNENHRKMLHKYLVFEHVYIIMVLTLILSLYQLIKGNYLMCVMLFFGGAWLMLKFLRESDVPYKLIFDGLTIYELNYVGKRIAEFNPDIIQSSNSDEYENDFIFISSTRTSKRYDENIKSLIIMEDFEFGIRDFLNGFFNKFKFETSINSRGEL